MLRATLALLLIAGALNAVDIYVAPGGNNANPGTIGSPKLTLAGAITAASNGDTIILRAGTYAGDVNVNRDNLTIRSHTGEWAVVSTSHTNSGNSQCIWITGSSCTLQRLEIAGGYFYAVKIEGTTNHIIEDCIVRSSGRDCIKLVPHSNNVTIRRCEIHSSGQRDNSNAEGIDNVNADNMHVHDCYIHDIATNGMYAKGGAVGCVFERNLIMDCGTGGIFIGFTTDSLFMNVAGQDNNPLYYENINGIVRNNIIINTFYAGIGLCSAQNPKVYNNTLINTATGGMSALHFHPRGGDNDQNPPCTGVDIRNNIVYMNQGTRPVMNVRTGVNGASQTYNTLDTSTFVLNHNIYYRNGGSVVFRNDQTGQTNLSFSAWATAMGTDANSFESNPQVNLATGHLEAASFSIDKGAAIAVTDDFDGNTRSGTLDVGADEAGGTALPVPPPAGTIGTGYGATPTAPSAPSSLSAVSAGSLTINVNWSDNSGNETGFELERDSGSGFVLHQSLGANVTSYADTGLSDGTLYSYRVRAVNAAGDSTYSNSASATAGAAAPPPPPAGGSGGGGGGGCAAAPNTGGMLALLVLAALALRRRVTA